jgi:hypothetical protein
MVVLSETIWVRSVTPHFCKSAHFNTFYNLPLSLPRDCSLEQLRVALLHTLCAHPENLKNIHIGSFVIHSASDNISELWGSLRLNLHRLRLLARNNFRIAFY